MNLKNRFLARLVGICIVIIFVYWFYGKFFPAQTGKWVYDQPENLSEEKVPNFGWRGGQFWLSVDYPKKQNVCLSFELKNDIPKNSRLEIIVTQSPRAATYPLAGNLDSLFQEQSPGAVAENISQDKPYLLNHLADNIRREGKDIFFIGDGEKFLIPTRNIFTAYFPALDVPKPSEQAIPLVYSNKLITFPEGVLLSDGKGVFVMSNGKLALIRSPEIFESLGYKWEEIHQMSPVELTFNPFLNDNLIDFDAAHPNGTALKNESELSLVWNEKRYILSEEERTKYFPGAPVAETVSRELKPSCRVNGNKKVVCCVDGFDPRLNAPQNFPFANTLNWDLEQSISQDKISRVLWQAKIAVNKENILHRLRSLANFILYTSGIVK